MLWVNSLWKFKGVDLNKQKDFKISEKARLGLRALNYTHINSHDFISSAIFCRLRTKTDNNGGKEE